jgi:hypothetical protein
MKTTVALILFAGTPPPEQPVLQQMQAVRRACARDLLDRVLASAAFDPIIVVTGDRVWANSIGDLPITIDLDDGASPFHFGRRLAGIVDRFHLERIAYMGAAAAPLLNVVELQRIATAAQQHDRVVIANNINSTDWAAIAPAAIVGAWIERLPSDNALGWVLSHDAGLTPLAWPPSPATRLDVDVPIDAQIAVLHPDCGPHLKELLARIPWRDVRLRAAREVLRVPATRLILAGRVPSWAWAQLEKTVQCWTRVYSEERGMRAAGRLGTGQVRSLLNEHLQAVGLQRFIADVSSMADAMLWDTRVLWAAHGVWPSEVDRYAADLGMVEYIADPFMRDFTQAVIEAPIPIVTGGHALVSGGLWALLDSL